MTRYVICIMIDAAKIDAVRENLSNMFDVGVSPVERRHVIYVSGYDPRGAQGYFDLFRRTCQRFERLWPVSAKLKPIEVASEDFARWGVDLRGPHWRTTTQLDFLRLENFIRSDMEKPTGRQVLRALGWLCGDFFSGTLFRIFAASWRFGLHLLYFQSLLLAWLAAAVIVAFATGHAARTFFDWSAPTSMAVSLLTAFATLVALRPFADRWRVVQISSCWKTLRRFGRGQVTWIDRAVDIGARHLIAVARASRADELVVVGHSTGGVIAAAIVDRALKLDPHLGRAAGASDIGLRDARGRVAPCGAKNAQHRGTACDRAGARLDRLPVAQRCPVLRQIRSGGRHRTSGRPRTMQSPALADQFQGYDRAR
jgi:hypothetical protein